MVKFMLCRTLHVIFIASFHDDECCRIADGFRIHVSMIYLFWSQLHILYLLEQLLYRSDFQPLLQWTSTVPVQQWYGLILIKNRSKLATISCNVCYPLYLSIFGFKSMDVLFSREFLKECVDLPYECCVATRVISLSAVEKKT